MTQEELIAELQAEIQEKRGTLVIHVLRIAKLIDLCFDEEDRGEPYWLFEYQDGSREYHQTLGRFIPIKGVLSEEDYDYLVWLWNHNVSEGTI